MENEREILVTFKFKLINSFVSKMNKKKEKLHSFSNKKNLVEMLRLFNLQKKKFFFRDWMASRMSKHYLWMDLFSSLFFSFFIFSF